MFIFVYLYRIFKRIIRYIWKVSWIITYLKFKLNKVAFKKNFTTNGIPITAINLDASVVIGDYFIMNNGRYYNMIGRQQSCYFVVDKNAKLQIGNNVGISAVAIVCWNNVIIGDNVKIGGNTVIYDTDFHSLNWRDRILSKEDKGKIKTSPVVIRDNVFIGTSCTILKGVEIGEKSIIGACSVVTKSIPSGEIWAGNPARFIRKVDNGDY